MSELPAYNTVSPIHTAYGMQLLFLARSFLAGTSPPGPIFSLVWAVQGSQRSRPQPPTQQE